MILICLHDRSFFHNCLTEENDDGKKLSHRQKQRAAKRLKKKEEWKEKRKQIKEKRKKKSEQPSEEAQIRKEDCYRIYTRVF